MSVFNEFYAGKNMVMGGEVCKMLGIHSNTLQRWIEKGVPIPFHQVPGMGRYFILEDVAAWWHSTKNYVPPSPPQTAAQEKAEQDSRIAAALERADRALAAVAALQKKEAA